MSAKINRDSLDKVLVKDSRYRREAYEFIFEALEFTLKRIKEKRSDAHEPEGTAYSERSAPYPKTSGRHISGQELLDGIRDYALDLFGPLGKLVFNKWGVHKTDDFGVIVFNLVDAGLLGKTEQDSIDDFRDRYDFADVFGIR